SGSINQERCTWSDGYIKPIHDGYRSGYRYSVIELMSAALQSNRKTYMSVAERREKPEHVAKQPEMATIRRVGKK
uniref:hypothetical protein n=1 Tax=Parapedobacter soli TaxID=416955 RepID=UPI0021C8E11A